MKEWMTSIDLVVQFWYKKRRDTTAGNWVALKMKP